MMNSFHELFSFFDNSQKFLSIVIDALSQENKIKAERFVQDEMDREALQATSETIFELYEYIAITLNEICVPTNDDERFYPNNEEWS